MALRVDQRDLTDHVPLSSAPLPDTDASAVLGGSAALWAQEHPLAVRRVVAVALAVWMLVAGVVLLVRPTDQAAKGPHEAAPATPVEPELAMVATARLPLVDVYETPTRKVVITTLEHPTASGAPLVFLVEAEWEDWFRVRVPAPPAGTVGWIRASDVEVAEHHVRITLDLDDHLLVAYEEGRVALRAPIAVGIRDQPEAGSTYVTEQLTLSNPRAGYGAYVLPLAGYANGEDVFFRGQGLVALHATDDGIDLGQTVPGGSIGLAKADMKALFDLAPPGTPVEILTDDSLDS